MVEDGNFRIPLPKSWDRDNRLELVRSPITFTVHFPLKCSRKRVEVAKVRVNAMCVRLVFGWCIPSLLSLSKCY
jgi:hypothetical protein